MYVKEGWWIYNKMRAKVFRAALIFRDEKNIVVRKGEKNDDEEI